MRHWSHQPIDNSLAHIVPLQDQSSWEFIQRCRLGLSLINSMPKTIQAYFNLIQLGQICWLWQLVNVVPLRNVWGRFYKGPPAQCFLDRSATIGPSPNIRSLWNLWPDFLPTRTLPSIRWSRNQNSSKIRTSSSVDCAARNSGVDVSTSCISATGCWLCLVLTLWRQIYDRGSASSRYVVFEDDPLWHQGTHFLSTRISRFYWRWSLVQEQNTTNVCLIPHRHMWCFKVSNSERISHQ